MNSDPNELQVTLENDELEVCVDGLEGPVVGLQLDLDAAAKWMENCVLGGK